MLSGIAHGQKEADFSQHDISPADAILIASDLAVGTALTAANLRNNSLDDEAKRLLRAAADLDGCESALAGAFATWTWSENHGKWPVGSSAAKTCIFCVFGVRMG